MFPFISNYKGKKIGICYKESSDVICDTDEYDIILDMKIVGWYFDKCYFINGW